MVKTFGFTKAVKLKKKQDFQFVYKEGKSCIDYAGIFYVVKADENKKSKIAVAVGKKLGNAVVRNRMKRLMREAYRLSQHKIAFGFNIAWIARKPLVAGKLDFYCKTFLKLAQKAGIYNLTKD